MTEPRDLRSMSIHGLTGGLAMFAAEALVVAGLATLAWLISVVILALL